MCKKSARKWRSPQAFKTGLQQREREREGGRSSWLTLSGFCAWGFSCFFFALVVLWRVSGAVISVGDSRHASSPAPPNKQNCLTTPRKVGFFSLWRSCENQTLGLFREFAAYGIMGNEQSGGDGTGGQNQQPQQQAQQSKNQQSEENPNKSSNNNSDDQASDDREKENPPGESGTADKKKSKREKTFQEKQAEIRKRRAAENGGDDLETKAEAKERARQAARDAKKKAAAEKAAAEKRAHAEAEARRFAEEDAARIEQLKREQAAREEREAKENAKAEKDDLLDDLLTEDFEEYKPPAGAALPTYDDFDNDRFKSKVRQTASSVPSNPKPLSTPETNDTSSSFRARRSSANSNPTPAATKAPKDEFSDLNIDDDEEDFMDQILNDADF